MEDTIRAVRNFRERSAAHIADIRKRTIVGSGVHTGTTMEYWKKKA